MSASVSTLEARQFSLADHPRTTPTRWPFVVATLEEELAPRTTLVEASTPTLDARQFSPNQPRTTPTRWPSVTIEAISTSLSVTATLKIVPTGPPANVDKQVYGAPCSPEGEWLCAGSSYQRCASGIWSQVMPLAQGMSCALYGIGTDTSINGGGGGGGGGGSSAGSPVPYSSGSPKQSMVVMLLLAGALIAVWL